MQDCYDEREEKEKFRDGEDMSIFILLIQKLVVMFIFMMMGAFLFKKSLITEEGSKCFGNLLIYLVLPCVIVNSFLTERTAQRMMALLLCLCLSVLILCLSIMVSRLLFQKDPIGHFAAAFSNPGFFGIPLISAVLGEEAVFYVAPFIACLNILQWTYGVSVLKEEKVKVCLKNIICSPFMIGFGIGILLFLSQVTIPTVARSVISMTANLNTPVAMLVSGVYLAKVDLKAMLKNRELYRISAVRLLIIPAHGALVLSLLPEYLYDVKMCLFIAAACPVGSNVAVHAQLHKKDYAYAVQTVVLSTLLSAFSIPMLVLTIQNVWH